MMGRQQARAFCTISNKQLKTTTKARLFKFAKGSQESTATVEARIPLTTGTFIPITVDIVEASIHFLLGLDVMTSHGMRIDTYRDAIWHPFES